MLSSAVPRLRPLNLGDLLDETFALYRQNFALFAGIVALLAIPQAILTAAAREGLIAAGLLRPLPLFLNVISFVFGQLIIGPLAAALSRRLVGERASIARSYAAIGGRTFFRLVGAAILTLLILAAGLLLLVFPFFIFLTRLLFVPEAVVLERRGIRDSLRRSWSLVRGSSWRVFGYWLVISLVAGIVEAVLAGIPTFLLLAGGGGLFVVTIFSAIAGILVQPFQLTALILLYYDLRIRKEGFDLEQMATTLGRQPPA